MIVREPGKSQGPDRDRACRLAAAPDGRGREVTQPGMARPGLAAARARRQAGTGQGDSVPAGVVQRTYNRCPGGTASPGGTGVPCADRKQMLTVRPRPLPPAR